MLIQDPSHFGFSGKNLAPGAYLNLWSSLFSTALSLFGQVYATGSENQMNILGRACVFAVLAPKLWNKPPMATREAKVSFTTLP